MFTAPHEHEPKPRHEQNTRFVDLKTPRIAGHASHRAASLPTTPVATMVLLRQSCVRVRTCTASAADARLNASEGRDLKAASVGPVRSGHRVLGRPERRARAGAPGSVSTAPPVPAARSARGLAPSSMCGAGQPARLRSRGPPCRAACLASVSERDKPRIKKNGKARRDQGRVWYSRGAVSDGDLNTQRLALTSVLLPLPKCQVQFVRLQQISCCCCFS